MEQYQRLVCDWCKGQNPVDARTCATCGAPLDVRDLVSDSGWREAPRLRDMTEFHFGQSVCQVAGELVPVAELNLGQGDSVYFEHHVMLWKDPYVAVGVVSLPGGLKRSFAGMPYIVTYATGPGRIALSRDQGGELVVLPLHPGMEIDTREHAFLAGSHNVSYSFVRIQGLANILHGGNGMYMDRFVTGDQPGIVLLHGYGNVMQRDLQAGESIDLEPGSFLYKDSSVQMDTVQVQLTSGIFGGRKMYLARCTGPGRVGIQSMYVHHNTE